VDSNAHAAMLALRASGPIGAFLCARDDASVLPLLVVHFNIVMYALGMSILAATPVEVARMLSILELK